MPDSQPQYKWSWGLIISVLASILLWILIVLVATHYGLIS